MKRHDSTLGLVLVSLALVPLAPTLACSPDPGQVSAADGLEGAVQETILEIRAEDEGLLGLDGATLRELVERRLAQAEAALAGVDTRPAEHQAAQLRVLRGQLEARLDALPTADPAEARSLRLAIAQELAQVNALLVAADPPR